METAAIAAALVAATWLGSMQLGDAAASAAPRYAMRDVRPVTHLATSMPPGMLAFPAQQSYSAMIENARIVRNRFVQSTRLTGSYVSNGGQQ